MPELILTVLRLIFLALVYLFIWQVARAITRHIGLGQGQGRGSKRSVKQVAVIRSDTQGGMTFAVNGATVVGRSDQADVVIEDPYASEFHFRLVLSDGVLTVSDLGSTNGTYVNGKRITTPTNLRRGDALQVGKTVMEVR
ncbi:MAG TPA: FHA domain-containing protein [Acidimicrobiia bacterium]|jgi:pSer/pThr/pTyr-binding forkhead associated (FHA) protein|nr:FHA domain-containing protein [Acidimicrobiia bacterium]